MDEVYLIVGCPKCNLGSHTDFNVKNVDYDNDVIIYTVKCQRCGSIFNVKSVIHESSIPWEIYAEPIT